MCKNSSQGIRGGSADTLGLRQLLLVCFQGLPNLHDSVAKLLGNVVIRACHLSRDVIDVDGEDHRG